MHILTKHEVKPHAKYLILSAINRHSHFPISALVIPEGESVIQSPPQGKISQHCMNSEAPARIPLCVYVRIPWWSHYVCMWGSHCVCVRTIINASMHAWVAFSNLHCCHGSGALTYSVSLLFGIFNCCGIFNVPNLHTCIHLSHLSEEALLRWA